MARTPAVSASNVSARYSDIATTSLTLESFTSTPLMVTSHESVPSPISVTSTSYPSVTCVHSLGLSSLIPISTGSSTLFPQFPTLNHTSSDSPSIVKVNHSIDGCQYHRPQPLSSIVCYNKTTQVDLTVLFWKPPRLADFLGFLSSCYSLES